MIGGETYESISTLNKRIDHINRSCISADYVLDYYMAEGKKRPSINFLDAEYRRLNQWLHKSSEQQELIAHLKLGRPYLRSVGIGNYLESR